MLTLFLALSGAVAPGASLSSLSESLAGPVPVQEEPASEATDPEWTGSVTVGGKYAFGNSETRSANATADAELRRENDRFSLGFPIFGGFVLVAISVLAMHDQQPDGEDRGILRLVWSKIDLIIAPSAAYSRMPDMSHSNGAAKLSFGVSSIRSLP